MKATFSVQEHEYQIALEKKERAEGDKFNPFGATVTGQPGGAVAGTCQITDSLLEAAGEKAGSGAAAEGDLLAQACGRSLAAELVIRKLKPEFSFVVDHRWLD